MLSPLDGRYAKTLADLAPYFSESALMKARTRVEVEYFIALSKEKKITHLPLLSAKQEKALRSVVENWSKKDAKAVKQIEKTTNHDVKAIEYFLKKRAEKIPGLKKHTEFIHFCLTSEDVNNLSYSLMIHSALKEVVIPEIKSIKTELEKLGKKWSDVTMLSLTHGQPATPTTVGKELMVFADRLERQLEQLKAFKMQGKFGGAVGNYAAHTVGYPDLSWPVFGRKFMRSLGVDPLEHTTQSNPHDDIAELSHALHRVGSILLDYSRDMWLYISRGIFKQRVVAGEVGSSAMPHKVNPIDFENAEGNLGIANALFTHFAEKLPVSRLQRDLSDSTVQRNIGSAVGYHLLALRSLKKGLKKIALNRKAVRTELHAHPEVLAEPIQIILRKKGVKGAYETLKELTRGEKVSVVQFIEFMEQSDFSQDEMKQVLGYLE